jgi:HEAT repeat protein
LPRWVPKPRKPVVVKGFKDADENIRLSTVAALRSIGTGDKECQAVLMKLLESREPHMRERAALQLGEYGSSAKESISALLVVLKDHDTYNYVRVAAVRALGQIDPTQPEVWTALIKALSDKRKIVQKAAVTALKNSN